MEQYSWVGHGRNNLIGSLNSDTLAEATWAGLGWAGFQYGQFSLLLGSELPSSSQSAPALVMDMPALDIYSTLHMHILEWFGTGFTLQWVLLTYLISPEPWVSKINSPPWVRSIASLGCLGAANGFNQKQLELARDFDRESREVPSLLVFSHQNG